MEEAEKEKTYREALGYLTSALSNEDLRREAIAALEALGDYKDARAQAQKYRTQLAEHKAEEEQNARRRRITVAVQWIMTGLGALLALGILFLILYGILT